MGMFDEIKINLKQFGLSKEDKLEDFQTKDLDSLMENYQISDDGTLNKLIYTRHEIPVEERVVDPDFPTLGKYKWTFDGFEHFNFTGMIHFYNKIGKDWIEINAFFENGNMIKFDKLIETY